MTTSLVRTNGFDIQPSIVTDEAKNKATAARLGKAFEKAILGDGIVEILPGLPMGMADASSLIHMALEDEANVGGSIDENMAQYIHNAVLDHIINYRNGDGARALCQPLP